jgi:DNA-binding NarL/FixJ family response regulator
VNIFALYSPILPHMSRYDRPSHRVYMTFFSRDGAKIILLTVYEGRDFVDAAFSAGVCGYVNKGRLSTDLIPAIHEAMLGRTFISAPAPRR